MFFTVSFLLLFTIIFILSLLHVYPIETQVAKTNKTLTFLHFFGLFFVVFLCVYVCFCFFVTYPATSRSSRIQVHVDSVVSSETCCQRAGRWDLCCRFEGVSCTSNTCQSEPAFNSGYKARRPG